MKLAGLMLAVATAVAPMAAEAATRQFFVDATVPQGEEYFYEIPGGPLRSGNQFEFVITPSALMSFDLYVTASGQRSVLQGMTFGLAGDVTNKFTEFTTRPGGTVGAIFSLPIFEAKDTFSVFINAGPGSANAALEIIALEITATPVPLPAPALLLLSSAAVLTGLGLRGKGGRAHTAAL